MGFDHASDRVPIASRPRGRRVETRPYYEVAVPDLTAFTGIVASADRSRTLASRSFAIPILPHLGDDDIERVIDACRVFYGDMTRDRPSGSRWATRTTSRPSCRRLSRPPPASSGLTSPEWPTPRRPTVGRWSSASATPLLRVALETLPATRRIAWLGEPLRGRRAGDRAPGQGVADGPHHRRRLDRTAHGRPTNRGFPAGSSTGASVRRSTMTAGSISAVHRRAARDGIRLVVTSADRAASLRRVGIRARVSFGYHPVHAGPPHAVDDADRDIDVLVLATDASGVPTRRARARRGGRGAGLAVRVELAQGGAWGADRHRLIARARVVLNINRAPGNFTGIRTVLVGAAGAALVSEPVDNAGAVRTGRSLRRGAE